MFKTITRRNGNCILKQVENRLQRMLDWLETHEPNRKVKDIRCSRDNIIGQKRIWYLGEKCIGFGDIYLWPDVECDCSESEHYDALKLMRGNGFRIPMTNITERIEDAILRRVENRFQRALDWLETNEPIWKVEDIRCARDNNIIGYKKMMYLGDNYTGIEDHYLQRQRQMDCDCSECAVGLMLGDGSFVGNRTMTRTVQVIQD